MIHILKALLDLLFQQYATAVGEFSLPKNKLFAQRVDINCPWLDFIQQGQIPYKKYSMVERLSRRQLLF